MIVSPQKSVVLASRVRLASLVAIRMHRDIIPPPSPSQNMLIRHLKWQKVGRTSRLTMLRLDRLAIARADAARRMGCWDGQVSWRPSEPWGRSQPVALCGPHLLMSRGSRAAARLRVGQRGRLGLGLGRLRARGRHSPRDVDARYRAEMSLGGDEADVPDPLVCMQREICQALAPIPLARDGQEVKRHSIGEPALA